MSDSSVISCGDRLTASVTCGDIVFTYEKTDIPVNFTAKVILVFDEDIALPDGRCIGSELIFDPRAQTIRPVIRTDGVESQDLVPIVIAMGDRVSAMYGGLAIS